MESCATGYAHAEPGEHAETLIYVPTAISISLCFLVLEVKMSVPCTLLLLSDAVDLPLERERVQRGERQT
jgi:hypothetical protein